MRPRVSLALLLALPAVAIAEPLPDGPYACLILGTGATLAPVYNASVLGTIVLEGGAYRSTGYHGSGKVAREGERLRFGGGPFDGWVAAVGRNSSGPFFRFREKAHSDPGGKTEIGDHLCFLRKK